MCFRLGSGTVKQLSIRNRTSDHSHISEWPGRTPASVGTRVDDVSESFTHGDDKRIHDRCILSVRVGGWVFVCLCVSVVCAYPLSLLLTFVNFSVGRMIVAVSECCETREIRYVYTCVCVCVCVCVFVLPGCPSTITRT